MQSCMLQMTCSIPIFNNRKLKERRNWLHYIHLLKGVWGGGGLCPPKASDILENQMKWKRFLYRNNQQY